MINEVLLSYLELEKNISFHRTLTNLEYIKESLLEIYEEDKTNTLLNAIPTVIVNWTKEFNELYHSLITFNYYKHENELRFDFSTNLPEIHNETYFSIMLRKLDENNDYSNIVSLSASTTKTLLKHFNGLYNDSFFYFTLPIKWIIEFLLNRHVVELSKEIDNEKINFIYYVPDDKTYIEIYMDIDRLDVVRDRWYNFLSKDDRFTIAEDVWIMSKESDKLSIEDKTLFVTTVTSMLAILKTRFTDNQIKKLITKKGIEETLKLINEINESK